MYDNNSKWPGGEKWKYILLSISYQYQEPEAKGKMCAPIHMV